MVAKRSSLEFETYAELVVDAEVTLYTKTASETNLSSIPQISKVACICLVILVQCSLSVSSLVVAEANVHTDTGEYAEVEQTGRIITTEQVREVGSNVYHRSYVVPLPLQFLTVHLPSCFALEHIKRETCTNNRIEVISTCYLQVV